jgi:2-polyprenyl-3-methyl-5-hydroxy-6-metoxy-1,4-benzoquinol methylase
VVNLEAEKQCPVCGSRESGIFAHARDVEYYTSDKSYSYLSCGQCGSIYLQSPPADRLNEIYPANYYSYETSQQLTSLPDRIKSHLDARLFRKLIRLLPNDDLRVLDVGGGSGWLLSLIRSVPPRVKSTHEVDIQERARPAAESAGHVYHSCRIEEFSSEESFDLILLLNLIEHVTDPGAVLVAMRKLLSPHGLILIKTPNVDTLDCRLFRNHNWGGFHCPRHFVLFNRQSIMDLGQRCGLRVEKINYTQGAPQWAASVLGWLGLRGWARVSADRPLYQNRLYPYLCGLFAMFDFLRSPFMPTAQMFVVFRLMDGAE